MNQLSEQEHELIDQLYFVTPYQDLADMFQDLDELLTGLLKRKFIKQMADGDGDYIEQITPDTTDLKKYHYLASKHGLFAHNGVEL